MPEPKIAFIDPEATLAALTPVQVAIVDDVLGPNPPHHDEDPVEVPPVVKARPVLSPSPGAPPPVGAPHYTEILDEIWPEFDDPEERTAARLESLLDEVADEAQRVSLLKQRMWEKLPKFKLPESERKRFDREFLAYIRRLAAYRNALEELEPDDTATDAVYIGLVKRKQGAGPVPDCIMHMYFAQQLGILSDHAEDMGKGFVGRVMTALGGVDRLIDDAADRIDDAEQGLEDRLVGWWERVTKPWLWASGLFVGALVLVGGTVVIVKATKQKEPQP